MVPLTKVEVRNRVRGLLDELGQNDSGFILSDKDSLELDTIIDQSALVAARQILISCNAKYLDGISIDTPEVVVMGRPPYLKAVIKLPQDFLRLVAFKLTSWDYPVVNVIYQNSPEYHMQKNQYMCGTPNKPICAFVNDSDDSWILEAYSAIGANDVVQTALYVPIPSWQTNENVETINMCTHIIDAFITLTTANVLLSINEMSRAEAFLKKAEIMYK